MRVYHFRSKEFGLRSIRERRLKIARITELNDPFEFLGINLRDRNLRFVINSTKEELSKTKGLICFSKYWKNPILWSHYADRHRGICLGFDISDDILEKVRYVGKRIHSNGAIDFSLIKKLLATKFKHWSYEQEYRAYIDLDPENQENGLYFMKFSDKMALKSVIVGHSSDITRDEVKEALGDLSEKVEALKARAAFTKFEVIANENESRWV